MTVTELRLSLRALTVLVSKETVISIGRRELQQTWCNNLCPEFIPSSLMLVAKHVHKSQKHNMQLQ